MIGRGPLVVLFSTVFMDLVGFGIVIPLLALFAEEWNAGHLTIGLLFSAYSLMQFLFAPMWGWLSDRAGRRPIILISLAGSTLSYVLFAWACVAASLPLLFASRILAGVMGANIPVAQAYIADVTPPKRRAAGMGLIGAAFGLGFILGPGLAGVLLFFGVAGPGIGAAVICGANFLLASVRLPESLAPEHRRRGPEGEGRFALLVRSLHTPGLRGLLGMFFLFTVALAIWESVLPVFCGDRFGWDKQAMAWVFTYVGVLGAFVQGYLVRRLSRTHSERALILVGSVLGIAAYAAIAAAPQAWLHLVALALLALAIGFTSPSLLGLISRRAGADEQGRVLGVSQSLSSLARVVGPMIGYGLFHLAEARAADPAAARWDEAVPFVAAALMLAVVLATALGIRRDPD